MFRSWKVTLLEICDNLLKLDDHLLFRLIAESSKHKNPPLKGSDLEMNQPSTYSQWWNYRPVRVYNKHQEDVAGRVDADSKLKAHARDNLAILGPDLGRARSWLYLLCLFWGLVLTQAHPAAKRLHDDLLSDYNRLIRPVGNHSHKVIIHLGLKLSQLIDIVSNIFFILYTFNHKHGIAIGLLDIKCFMIKF